MTKAGKADMGEKPQLQVGGYIVEAVAPEVLMNFELKWVTEVPPLDKQKSAANTPTTIGFRRREGERPIGCACNII